MSSRLAFGSILPAACWVISPHQHLRVAADSACILSSTNSVSGPRNANSNFGFAFLEAAEGTFGACAVDVGDKEDFGDVVAEGNDVVEAEVRGRDVGAEGNDGEAMASPVTGVVVACFPPPLSLPFPFPFLSDLPPWTGKKPFAFFTIK